VGALVGVSSLAGAASFGPVDHTLADGAANSLRDIVTNQATNAGGDTVNLEPGQTYTLTCGGGGALVHGNTLLRLVAGPTAPPGPGVPPPGDDPATIQQTCPATPILSHPGSTQLTLQNVNLTGGTALMSPPCSVGGPTTQRTWSTTNHTTDSRVDLAQQDAFSTRVLGVIIRRSPPSQQVVFDQTTPNSPSSAPAQALFAQAAAASAAGTVAQTGPTLIASADTSNTVHVGDLASTSFSTTTDITVGPGTAQIGQDLSETLFVPPGCASSNDNTDTEHLVEHQFQTTVTHNATFQTTGLVAMPTFTG